MMVLYPNDIAIQNRIFLIELTLARETAKQSRVARIRKKAKLTQKDAKMPKKIRILHKY